MSLVDFNANPEHWPLVDLTKEPKVLNRQSLMAEKELRFHCVNRKEVAMHVSLSSHLPFVLVSNNIT